MQHKTTHILSFFALFLLILSIVIIVPSIVLSDDGRPPENDSLITRRVGTQVYFAHVGVSRLNAYDLTTQSWTQSINFGDEITAFDADQEGIYVAFGRRLSRFDLDGSNESHLGNTSNEIEYVHVFELFVAYGWYDSGTVVTTITKNDGTFVDTDKGHFDDFSDGVKSVTLNRIYGHKKSTSKSLLQFAFDDSGEILAYRTGRGVDSSLTELHISPDEGLLIDDYGRIHFSTDLTRGGSLNTQGKRVNDVIFHGALPLLLFDNVVTAYSKRYEQAGQYTLPNTPVAIEAHDGKLFAFEAVNFGSTVRKVPISAITSEDPDTPLDAATLDFEPNFIEYADGIAYVYSKKYRSIFRYSLDSGQYLPPLDVRFAGSHMAYSPSTHSFVLAHNADLDLYGISEGPGVIDVISAENNTAQYGVIDGDSGINGIATADDLIFTCRYFNQSSGNRYRYIVEDRSGQELASYERHSCRFSQAEWHAATRRLYFSDYYDRVGYAEIGPDGNIDEIQEVHSYQTSAGPIRVSPDGTKTIDGSGRVRDATTLEQIDALPYSVADAAWYADGLYTIRDSGNDSALLSKWRNDLSLDKEIELPGKPYYMAAIPEGLLTVTKWSGKMHYSIWDAELEMISGSQLYRSLMPAVVSNLCSGPIVDDFSDPTSGWPTLQTDVYTGGYHNGKYRLLHEIGGYWTAFTRGDNWDKSDLVQIEGQVTSGDAVWGLVFGLNDDWSDFYTLEIIPQSQRFFLLHFTSETGWTVVNTNKLSIISQHDVNTLQLKKINTQNPDEIDVRINGYLLFTRSIPTGRIGLTGGSFEDGTEIRYDNYIFGDRYCVITRAPEQGADSIAIPWSGAALESIDQ